MFKHVFKLTSYSYSSAALNAYYAQMQMDSITRSSVCSPLTTSTPATTSQGQPHILRKASRKRNRGENDVAVSSILSPTYMNIQYQTINLWNYLKQSHKNIFHQLLPLLTG